MTIALQLDEPELSALSLEAATLGVSPEELATDIVLRHLSAQTSTTAVGPGNAKFQAALAASMSANEELLRRLAQ